MSTFEITQYTAHFPNQKCKFPPKNINKKINTIKTFNK